MGFFGRFLFGVFFKVATKNVEFMIVFGGRAMHAPTFETMLISRRGVCFKLNVRRWDVRYCYDNRRGRPPGRPAFPRRTRTQDEIFPQNCNYKNIEGTGVLDCPSIQVEQRMQTAVLRSIPGR